jgi:purine-binding chemotaxis protein CheW
MTDNTLAIPNGAKVQYCQFHVHGMIMGIPTAMVLEVIKPRTITPVPLAPRTVPGLFNLRGQIITAVDVRRCLEFPDHAPDKAPMNLLISHAETSISLLVDRIGDVIEVSEEKIEELPHHLQGAAREYLVGAYQAGETLLLILDVESMVTDRAVLGSRE